MISIITATYNSAKTIEQTLKSVLNQSYTEYEYIIVDGDSSDSTLEIIKKYIIPFNGKLKYISEPDNGIYDAWNKGINMAKGEWICFVGSDDILYENALENYYNKIRYSNKNINFISSKIELVTNDLKTIKIVGEPWSNKMKNHCTIAHVGAMHKIDLFRRFGVYSIEYQICSDYEFLLRNYNYIIPEYLDVITAKMRIDGVSNNRVYLVLKETYKIKNKYSSFYRKFFNFIYYTKALIGVLIKNTVDN